MSGINSVIDSSKEGLFAAALPDEISQWSAQLLRASRAAGVNPWVLAGIMYRESRGGEALSPRGPYGTGDTYHRAAGHRYANGYVVPASGLPEDGRGWGRGLMQIDWAVHHVWASQYAWFDAQTNIDYAAGLVRQVQEFFAAGPGSPVVVSQARMDGLTEPGTGKVISEGWRSKYGLTSTGPFPDPRPLSGDALTKATLAAYNAGTSGVLQAIAAGLPASAPTAHNDYADWVLERVVAWASAIG